MSFIHTRSISGAGTMMQLPASEIIALAQKSIAEIRQKRKQQLHKALVACAKQTRPVWFGLSRVPAYRDEADALAHAPELQGLQHWGRAEELSCQWFMKTAEYLINNPTVADEDKYMVVSLDDLRYLLPMEASPHV